MTVHWSAGAREDLAHWRTCEPRVAERIDALIKAIGRDPFRGMGKPEPLRGPLSGWWSRRITREHRLVYRVERGAIWVIQARYHY